MSARPWAEVFVPAVLVLALEWLLGFPVVVCVLLAVAVASATRSSSESRSAVRRCC